MSSPILCENNQPNGTSITTKEEKTNQRIHTPTESWTIKYKYSVQQVYIYIYINLIIFAYNAKPAGGFWAELDSTEKPSEFGCVLLATSDWDCSDSDTIYNFLFLFGILLESIMQAKYIVQNKVPLSDDRLMCCFWV